MPFFHKYSRITGQRVKGETISLYPFYHFHPLHRHLDITWVIAAPLRILAARIEHGIFGTCSLEFTLSSLALVAAVVRRMLKIRVTLGNVSRVLLNLTKRLIFLMFKDSSFLSMYTNLTVIFSQSYFSFVFLPICLISFMICTFNWEEFIYGTFEDSIGLFNSHYCSFLFQNLC